MKMVRGYSNIDRDTGFGDDSTGLPWFKIVSAGLIIWLLSKALLAPRAPGRSGLI